MSELDEFAEALETALFIMTDEQFDEYQRQRRAKFMERIAAKNRAT